MCFYMGLKAEPYQLSKRYQKKIVKPELFVPKDKFNGFAHPQLPIVCTDAIVPAQWGLIPAWASEANFAKNTLNARIETLAEKPSFKDVLHNRCLLPATCFYDWRHEGKNKIPYVIYSQEDAIFSMAAIFSDWQDAHGTTHRTFSILTTEANEVMQFIHNTKHRMPVIVKATDEQSYLQGSPIANFAYPYSTQLLSFTVPD